VQRRIARISKLICPPIIIALLGSPRAAEAQAAGGHLGINLDHGNVHLGVDGVFSLVDISPRVSMGIWPSYAHVFIEDGHDVELLGCDLPFSFHLARGIVTPFVAPGFGLAFFGDTSVKVNAIGGMFFETKTRIQPFAALALRFVNGTYADLLGGVLVKL
jgi:hypothetical protein